MRPAERLQSLQIITSEVLACKACVLHKGRVKVVPGDGSLTADIMFIGEAPGYHEDQQGIPFVGASGQYLERLLGMIGLKRQDVFIANVIKCRPPNNRDPEPAEVEAHLPILFKQIALIRPVMLLCVGRVAGNALLGRTSSLASLRNRIHDFHGLPVVVTYHPAALLRNEQWKRPTWEDMQMLRKRFDQLTAS